MKDAQTRVMVVEDEKIVAMEIQDRLTAMGYNVVSLVSSGEEAVADANKKNPDLTLMDIKLKGYMDGVQAAELIRAKLDIPVIYLTAYADIETLQRAKITEPFGYILKPFDERELYTTIEMALYKHKMERKIKESKQRFETTLNSISDAVIATNKDGFITFMNPVAERLTGWKKEDAMGELLTKIYYVTEEKIVNETEELDKIDLFNDNMSKFSQAKILSAKDGSERIVEDSMSPIQHNGEISGVVLVFRDITNKRKLEQEIIKAQKLESLGVLAGGIAHDFNNVLTAIIGNISIAKLHTEQNDDVFKLLREVDAASNHAKTLTRQLLTFAKGGEPIKRVVDIKESIKNAVSFALKGSPIRPQFEIAENLFPVEIDDAQITQALYNILNNAKQAQLKESKILIKVENNQVTFDQKMAINPGNYIRISVQDTGSGIDSNHLQKIFDPYFTTKKGATGLGLAISYSIIKKHGGTIIVDSKIGIGTTFSIFLPASTKQTMSVTAKERQTSMKKGKILVMDDEPLIRNLIKRMLRILGHEAEVVKNGEEAIVYYLQAMEAGQPFDLVILDLTVQGGMGGKDTIEKLIKLDPKLKAIVSSGYSNDPIMSNYREHGFSGVVAKPYETEELKKVVHELLP